MNITRFLGIACLTVAMPSLRAQAPVSSGEFFVEPPTLVSLGFEWKVTGDDNRNASVDVTYRRKNGQQWQKGLALMRSQGETIEPEPGLGEVGGGGPRYPAFRYTAPNMFEIGRAHV